MRTWRRFKENRLAYRALILLVTMLISSALAEWIANGEPIAMRFQGKLYFPVVQNITGQDLGVDDQYRVDYRSLVMREGDWAFYPPVRFGPNESNKKLEKYPSPPSTENILGTDDRGRDVFARLLYGFRYSVGYAICVWILSYLIGINLGLFMGYFGGWIDLVGQRLVELVSSVPVFFLLITLISIFQPSLWLLIVISSIFGWISISYYVRAEVLKLRRLEFIEAGKALGMSHFRLFFRHVLPNALTPIIAFTPFQIAGGITGLAALDYLGFGLMPPTPSWGELLKQASGSFTTAWWLAVYPSLALFSTLILLNFVGDGLRNAFDPRFSVGKSN